MSLSADEFGPLVELIMFTPERANLLDSNSVREIR